MPVEAPDGTAARKVPLLVVRSTSTVGLPRLRRIREIMLICEKVLANVYGRNSDITSSISYWLKLYEGKLSRIDLHIVWVLKSYTSYILENREA